MSAGEIVALIIGLATICGMLFGVLMFLFRLQMAHNDLRKDQQHDNEWLERTSGKVESTNKVVRLVYMNQIRIMDKMEIKGVNPEDSNIDLPSV